MGYRILDHTADIGVEVDGATLTDIFREGAAALFALLTDGAAIAAAGTRVIRVEGMDRTDLWVNYLREILYLFNGESFLVREVEDLSFFPSSDDMERAGHTDRSSGGMAPLAVTSSAEEGRIPAAGRFAAASPAAGDDRAGGVAGLALTARCVGEVYDPRRHAIATEIKAVTYHHAEVEPTPAGWRGVFIVDV